MMTLEMARVASHKRKNNLMSTRQGMMVLAWSTTQEDGGEEVALWNDSVQSLADSLPGETG